MQDHSISISKLFLYCLTGLLVLRAVINASIPLSGEEAYYWAWSQRLDLCYFDHPPLVAWIIRLCTTACGHSPFAVRLSALLCHSLTAISIYFCTLRISNDRNTAGWAGLCYTVAIFFAAMATMAIPEFALFLFWTLTLWLTIEATRPGGQRMWPAAGLALGMCGLAKFHGILLALSIALYLLIVPGRRNHFRCGWLYLGMAIAAGTTLPVFIWNAQEGWPTFGFQLAERHRFILGDITYIMEMLFMPFGYIGPLLFPLAISGIVWGFKAWYRTGKDHLLLLALAGALPYLFFLVLSIFIKIDAQWAAPAFIAGMILAALQGRSLVHDSVRSQRQCRFLRNSVATNAALMVACYGLVALLLVLPNLIPRDIIVLKHRAKKFNTKRIGRIYGWQEIGHRVAQEVTMLGGPTKSFIVARIGWCTASSISFYAGGKTDTFIFDYPPQDGHQYYLWEKEAHLEGKNAVVIAKREKYVDLDVLQHYFQRAERVPDLVVERAGREQQRYYLARCWNLQKQPNKTSPVITVSERSFF